jgi:hypothetical protein
MKVTVKRFWVQGSGFKVLGSKVQGSRFRVQSSRFWVQGSGFKVLGSGFWVQGSTAPLAAEAASLIEKKTLKKRISK